jgi:glutamate synthase (NADPH) small chain
MGIGKKSFLSPFSFWKNLFKKPTTIRYPKEDINEFDKKGASPSYRGLHTNDIETCIGCGTCEDICPTNAITMIEADNVGEGKLGKRPQIDYGRCCFCAFCVDVCPSSSIKMSRDYLHNYPTPPDVIGLEEVHKIKEEFIITPGEEHKDNIGYNTPDELSWLDLERIEMHQLNPEQRWDSFIEIVKGFSKKEAKKEAERCIECGVCKETCPANMDIPEYIRSIWEDDIEGSVRHIYKTNPLPNVCGRVCTHKCETVCSLRLRGKSVAIRWLKRYAVDNLPTEKIQQISSDIVQPPKNKNVAIIGAGPSGLSAGYYLSLMGYNITIYEKREQPGGIMRYGIPNYRLPLTELDRDIDVIKSLGVEIKTGMEVGKDITLDEIKERADAVFIATGYDVGASTRIEGIDQKGYKALELLSKIMTGQDVHLDKEIVIIGGGNVAFDIARSLARLQRKHFGEVNVTLTCLEKEGEMLADDEEIEEGQEEGLTVLPGRSPQELILDPDGNVEGLKTVKCVSIFDENGRFNPTVDKSDELIIKGKMVVEAIGQRPDFGYLGELKDKLEIVRGKILTDEYGKTNIEWLFAGGDIVHGPDIIHGIADGNRAAKAIDEYLS